MITGTECGNRNDSARIAGTGTLKSARVGRCASDPGELGYPAEVDPVRWAQGGALHHVTPAEGSAGARELEASDRGQPAEVE